MAEISPLFFPRPEDFRQWLEENHRSEDELWVGYYKKHTGIASITWPESVDQALCFGWIDGLRKSVDDKSYKIRFTPRRPNSIWSAVNIARVKELTREGLMQPAGLEAYAKLKKNKAQIYSYEQKEKAKLPAEYEAMIRDNAKAWKFFNNLAPSYRKNTVYWIISAKREETRKKRMKILIESSEKGLKIPHLRRPGE